MAAVMPPHLGGHAQVQVRPDEPAPVGRFHGVNGPGHDRPLGGQLALNEARHKILPAGGRQFRRQVHDHMPS